MVVLILCFVYQPLCPIIFRIFEPFSRICFVLFTFNCSACFRCIITKQQTLLMIIFSTNYSICICLWGWGSKSEHPLPSWALNNNIEILEYQFELVISVEIAFILYLTDILIFIFISLSPFPSVDDVSCVCFDVIQLCKDDATVAAASVAILVPIIVVIVGLSVLCLFFFAFSSPIWTLHCNCLSGLWDPKDRENRFQGWFHFGFQPAVAEPP